MGLKLSPRAACCVTQARRHRRTGVAMVSSSSASCVCVAAAPALTTSQPRLAAQTVHGGQLGGVAPEVVDARGGRED